MQFKPTHLLRFIILASLLAWPQFTTQAQPEASFAFQASEANPLMVSAQTGIGSTALGAEHSCALTTTRGVKCWGYNGNGQLGDGTMTERLTPVNVSGLGSGVTAIAAGGRHTCVLTTAGGVKCWGWNYYGQLGDGTTTQRLTPMNVSGLSSGVAAISSSYNHTCALTTTGGVKCWGWNSSGQLGDGTTTQRLTPVNVSGLGSGVTTIAAGGEHTCVLTTAGGVKCWGDNYYGQLGDGTTTDRLTPVNVSGLGSSVTAIAAGNYHTCALTTAGGVKCWGWNVYGQLGDGTTIQRLTPVNVSELGSSVTAIAAGNYHTCALTTTGGVKCWGANYYGQLGDGTTTQQLTPVNVSGLGSGVTAIAVGYWHACALTTAGGVKCWGLNNSGQLGDGTVGTQPVPVNVSGLSSGVTAIAAGGEHTCALTTAGGVKCWGDNDGGELGDGTTTNRLTPVNVSGLSSGVAAIASSANHTCALTTTGGVKCWGWNHYGQLGDGTTTQRLTPVNVSGLGSGVTAIVAGNSHTCALTTTGGVKCWGWNSSGQLGDGTTIQRLTPVNVSSLSSGMTAIAAGYWHSCALSTAGGVKCWGLNGNGQLGDGTTIQRLTPVNVSGLGSGVTAIAADAYQTCALTMIGGVKCWGWNTYGQLGDGTITDRLTPVNVSGLGSGVTAITVGVYHTCALTTAGGVKCWGANYYGQLGDGTTTQRLTPVNVSGLGSGVTTIAAGDVHTCVLTTAGGVKCWGYKGFGQLGDGSRAYSETPVAVVGLDGVVITYSISGGLADDDGNPIVGATVSAGFPHLATTDANGNYTINNLPTGNYAIYAYKPNFVFKPSEQIVNVSSNVSNINFMGNLPPIVFVHGWLGFPDGTDPATCSSTNNNVQISEQTAKEYFQSVDDQLDAVIGQDVFYARLVSNQCYTPPLQTNVKYLREAITQAISTTGQSKVILIAHSMGGLVSRAYIEAIQYRNDVSQLFTFGSPHLGLPIEQLLFLGAIAKAGTFCYEYQLALCDFSITNMTLFNLNYQRRGGVDYHFITGQTPFSQTNAKCLLLMAVVTTASDCVVPVVSGRGSLLGSIDRWTTDEKHSNIFGSPTYFVRSNGVVKSYEECLKPVLVDKTKTNCGSVGLLEVSAEAGPTFSDHTPVNYGDISSGQTITRTISLEGGPTLFATQWQTGTLSVTLRSPSNQLIDPAYASANPTVVSYTASSNAAVYYFPNLTAGNWKMVIQATSVPVSGTAYSTVAAFDSSVTLAGSVDRLWYLPNATATITATLSGSPASAIVTATVFKSDGLTTTVTLSPVGSGQFQGAYNVPNVPGYTQVQLTATGTLSNSQPFERSEAVAFQISPQTASLNNVYGEAVQPRPGAPQLYQALTVTVGINSSINGALGLSADLVDASGNFVAHSLTIRDVSTGANTLALRFEGADIYASQRNGPYTLTNLLLTDQTGILLALAEAQNVYTTAAYQYKDFDLLKLYLPLIRR